MVPRSTQVQVLWLALGVLVVVVFLLAPSMLFFIVRGLGLIFLWGPIVVAGLVLLFWLDKRERKKTDHETK